MLALLLMYHLINYLKLTESEQITALIGLTSSTHWIANKVAINSVVKTDT